MGGNSGGSDDGALWIRFLKHTSIYINLTNFYSIYSSWYWTWFFYDCFYVRALSETFDEENNLKQNKINNRDKHFLFFDHSEGSCHVDESSHSVRTGSPLSLAPGT